MKKKDAIKLDHHISSKEPIFTNAYLQKNTLLANKYHLKITKK
jgi:hypothetical protein